MASTLAATTATTHTGGYRAATVYNVAKRA